MKSVVLEELSSPGCHICRQFEEFWHTIEKDWPNVTYKNVSVITINFLFEDSSISFRLSLLPA